MVAWATSCWLATLAAANGRDLQGCRAITADRERLACYDAAADAPVTDSSGTDDADQESFGQESMAKKSADTKSETPQVLQAQVASVRTDASGKLILGLDNEQSWTQIDSLSLKLKMGDQVLIRRGALGSYLLTRVDGGPAIRVRRGR